MKVGIAGPFSTSAVADRLPELAPGFPGGLGGNPVCALVVGLLEAGHQVSVYSLDETVTTPVSTHGEGISVTYGPYRPDARARALSRFSVERAAIAEFVSGDDADVVHAHWTYEFAWGALAVRPEALVTVHDWAAAVLRYSPSLYRFSRWTMNASVLRRARFVTAVSPATASHLPGRLRDVCDIIPNIVAVDERAAAGRKPSGEARLLAVSEGFGQLKNLAPLLEAFPIVRRQRPGSSLTLVGSGSGDGGEVQAWARARHLDGDVRFVGPLPHAGAVEAMMSADILVHPSLEESFGMVVAEAMAAGTPVVAGAASGGVPWVTGEGAAGRLVDVRDPVLIANAVTDLLGDDEAWLAASSAGARRAAECFDAAVVTARYVEAYERSLAR
jgi:glycosyltransferase involved in cell wall biosynthesis